MVTRVYFLALTLFVLLGQDALGILKWPTFDEFRKRHTSSDQWLLDRHGTLIHEFRADHQVRRLSWIPLDEISDPMKRLVVTIEDKRFFSHKGVDWWSLGSVAIDFLERSKLRGASTITMQLVTIMDRDLKGVPHRDIARKWHQMQDALGLEHIWTKNEIFEAYLNSVFFRGELQGIHAASRGLFGKDPHGLDEGEALLLTALLAAPNDPWDVVAKRACRLSKVAEVSMSCVALSDLAEKSCGHSYGITPSEHSAPHVANILRSKSKEVNGTPPMLSTLDGGIQKFALELIRDQLRALEGRNVHDASLLVLDNMSGEVLAYVGNSGANASAVYVDGVRAKRQAGSTLKPFLYGLAIEKKIITAATLFNDSSLNVPILGGVYEPRNYDKVFHGIVTVRTALASSLNVPAVKVLRLIGVEDFIATLERLGFYIPYDSYYYGPSLALGAIEVSLWELVAAYRTLANGGQKSEIVLSEASQLSKKKQKVFSSATTFIISDILSDRESRALTFGLENYLSTRYWTSVKTGTSKDMVDNWCVGFSEDYTVGVWVGNFSGEPMWQVSGITGAGPIWLAMMNKLHVSSHSEAPKAPSQITYRDISFEHANNERREVFIRGTEPPDPVITSSSLTGLSSGIGSKIRYPVDGMTVTFDPDIPKDLQKIEIKADESDDHLTWQLDQENISSDQPYLDLVRLKRGFHSLRLLSPDGVEIDRVRFLVQRMPNK